jgi:hypothetical protein
MKIAFFYNKFPSSWLTKFWTGSTCYHVGIVDEGTNRFYDMNLLMRRRLWRGGYAEGHQYHLVESPVCISEEYMEKMLDTDENTYGWKDYLLFALRPVYHMFGKSTRNASGIICSEMVYNVLAANGWQHNFKEVPSPADLEKALKCKSLLI